jgi:hypothetical protein
MRRCEHPRQPVPWQPWTRIPYCAWPLWDGPSGTGCEEGCCGEALVLPRFENLANAATIFTRPETYRETFERIHIYDQGRDVWMWKRV